MRLWLILYCTSFYHTVLTVFNWTVTEKCGFSLHHRNPTISDAFPFSHLAAGLTARWPRPTSVVHASRLLSRESLQECLSHWIGSVGAKSTRPWLDTSLWWRRPLPMNEGGHLICVIASKSTLDSSLDGWTYNADAELFLPRQVIRWESCWRKIKSEISWWVIASGSLKKINK